LEEAKTANNTAITLGTAAHDGDNLEVVTIVGGGS
jgi:sulfur carrier protein ThiS